MILVLLVVVAATTVCESLSVISNTKPRLDTEGRILDAHDGNIQQWEPNGDFYWYSIGYSNCTEPQNTTNGCQYASVNDSCGFQYNHTINLYISPNLTSGL